MSISKQDLDDSHSFGGSERIHSTEPERFQRQRTETFQYVYCDYDISEMPSEVQSVNSSDSDEFNTVSKVVQDERWYDKSSKPYFTSSLTRNAQTISFKQRHRPVFQLYLDLQTGMFCAFFAMMGAILTIRGMETKESKIDFADVFFLQEERIVQTVFFFFKFLLLVIMYRCSSEGNILEKTNMIWKMRMAMDMILYMFIGYLIYIEYVLSGQTCMIETNLPNVVPATTGRIIPSVKVHTNPAECDMMLANWATKNEGESIIHIHGWRIAVLCVFLVKEIIVYFICVQRAASKLEQEKKTQPFVIPEEEVGEVIKANDDDYTRD